MLAHALSDENRIFAYGKLGSANSRRGEYDKAIANHEKALELGVETLGSEHNEVALSYHNIGSICLKKGEYDTAIAYHERAVRIWLESLGPEHPRWNNLCEDTTQA